MGEKHNCGMIATSRNENHSTGIPTGIYKQFCVFSSVSYIKLGF